MNEEDLLKSLQAGTNFIDMEIAKEADAKMNTFLTNSDKNFVFETVWDCIFNKSKNKLFENDFGDFFSRLTKSLKLTDDTFGYSKLLVDTLENLYNNTVNGEKTIEEMKSTCRSGLLAAAKVEVKEEVIDSYKQLTEVKTQLKENNAIYEIPKTHTVPTVPVPLETVCVVVSYHKGIIDVVKKLIETKVKNFDLSGGVLYVPSNDYKHIKESAPLLAKYLFSTCYVKAGIRMLTDSETHYNPVPSVRIKDKFDETIFDVLFGKMKIHLELSSSDGKPSCFPVIWKIDPTQTEISYRCEELAANNKIVTDNNNIEAWLKSVLRLEQRSQSHLEEWKKELTKTHSVERPEELCEWEEKDWSRLKSNQMIAVLMKHVDLLKAEKQGLSNSFNGSDDSALPWEMNLLQATGNQELLEGKTKESKESEAELIAVQHNILRYFLYHADRERYKQTPFLSSEAITKAREEVRKDFEGDHLLEQLQTSYMTFAGRPDIEGVRLSRGILLYGPPGTGKSTLTDKLPRRVGFTPVCQPLAAAEVNRSLVGETERLLVDLLTRANRLPHLVCYIAIDEIDGLAPKRDEKSSQGKNDALSVLLSLIGGIKDVKSLVFMASTNRLRQMDEAFLRRMNVKLFVGRPPPSARQRMLARINRSLQNERKRLEAEEGRLIFELSPEDEANLVVWTTNFSGAALDRLISDIIVHATLVLPESKKGKCKKEKPFIPIPTVDLLKMTDRVCDQFNFSFGGGLTLPGIFWEMNNDSKKCTTTSFNSQIRTMNVKKAESGFKWIDYVVNHSQPTARVRIRGKPSFDHIPYSGLLLFDLSSATVLIENKLDHKHDKIFPDDNSSLDDIEEMFHPPKSSKAVLQQCAVFAQSLNIDFMQLVNTDLFLMNAAYDETKVMEIFEEKVSECLKYPRCLIILDMDSIAAMNTNESESSMGTSTSYSITNTKLYNVALNLCTNRTVSVTNEGEGKSPAATNDSARVVWIAIMSQKRQLTKRIKSDLNLKRTEEDIRMSKEEEHRAHRVHKCLFCKGDFTIAENEKNMTCQYHDGKLFNTDMPPHEWIDNAIAEEDVNNEVLSRLANKVPNTEKPKKVRAGGIKQEDEEEEKFNLAEEKAKFIFICCTQPFGSPGCRKGYHRAEGVEDPSLTCLTAEEIADMKRERDEELADKLLKLVMNRS